MSHKYVAVEPFTEPVRATFPFRGSVKLPQPVVGPNVVNKKQCNLFQSYKHMQFMYNSIDINNFKHIISIWAYYSR